jgi:hypothetical protein
VGVALAVIPGRAQRDPESSAAQAQFPSQSEGRRGCAAGKAHVAWIPGSVLRTAPE